MKISYSEYLRFQEWYWNDPEASENLRFGQAWYNYFKLHKHNPASETERVLLNTIYNTPHMSTALELIWEFIDHNQ